MAIRTVVTRGYGNGTFNGTVPLVVLRGFIGAVIATMTASVVTLTGSNTATFTLSGKDDSTRTMTGKV